VHFFYESVVVKPHNKAKTGTPKSLPLPVALLTMNANEKNTIPYYM